MPGPALSHLDFNLLLDLEALLREGSVVGAARALHLSPPAMSRRLTRLREAIGDPLFVPAGRGLVPTQRALALRTRVQAAIEEVRSVFTPEDVDYTTLERTFTLRANDGFLGVWATRLASALAAVAPGVSLNFIPRGGDKNIEPLRHGIVDLDIGVPGPQEAEIHSEHLFTANFVGVARKNHPLFRKKTHGHVSAEGFVAWPHIAAPRRGPTSSRIDEALNKVGLSRRVIIVAPGFQAALVMVAASDFIATVPEPFVQWAMGHHRLQMFQLPVTTPSVAVSQTWHVRHHMDPVHCWLRQHVRHISQTDF
jgi:DNA-binding transcriptional LysR family regulator